MLETSPEYKTAITASTRRIIPLAKIELVSPDLKYLGVESSGETTYSKSGQLYDEELYADGPEYVTLEANRWLLDGSERLYPLDPDLAEGQQGLMGNAISGETGELTDTWVQLNVSGIEILQAASVFFTGRDIDGTAEDFSLDIYSGADVVCSLSRTGNTDSAVFFEGFTAYRVTALRLTVTKWTLPGHYLRTIEIVPGIRENWGGDYIYSIDVMHSTDFSCMTLPYGTASLEIRNETRRFDPMNKNGLFKSVEERQGVKLWLGPETPDEVEYVPLGVFHQQNGGWYTGNGGLTFGWKLVDIIGLVAKRKFAPPAALPTTLEGWIAAIVVQLGENFADRYSIDPELGALSVSCEAEDIENIECGDLLRYVCQATGTYPWADRVTGYLSARILPTEAAGINTLDNISDRPDMRANDDLAAIIFKLPDDAQYIAAGTTTASDKTVNVSNPFIKTEAQAQAAARNILVNYGGNKFTLRGRGDMAREPGDVELVEIWGNMTVSARRYKQQLKLSDGIMKNVPSYLVQATGAELYTEYLVITRSGSVTLPESVTQIKIMLVGGGDGGESGTSAPGAGGLGGKILVTTVGVNPGQPFTAVIGRGGEAGSPGEDTTALGRSSADGQRFDGYADIGTGLAFGRSGADGNPVEGAINSGNGGGGGTARGPGARGGSGCIIIYWEKEAGS